jgi:predicted Zn-dependent peptidase
MQFHTEVLPNGLRIVGETNPSARSVAVGFWVRTGSRDETPEVSGVTHFLEHMIFKGTERRDAFAVNRDLDRIGANPNAFTSEENTVFYSSVLPEYLPQVIDVLSDILRPSLRAEDFDVEKKVIIEEIGKYEDKPSWLAADHARRLFFGEHRLGNSVLGTVDSIRALTRDQMCAYFRRRYVAPNITAAVAGAFDWPELVELVRRHCGGWEAGPVGREQVCEVQGTGRFEVEKRDKSALEHVILASSGPPADSPMRHAATVLGLAVGDEDNSRLHWALVHPGRVESASCGLDSSEGAGTVYTSFSCEPDKAEESLAIVHGILEEVQREGIREDELQLAKTKIQSYLVRASERSDRRMFDLGMSWTYLGRYRSVDDELADFDAVTAQRVREVLDRYPLTRVTTLALGPLPELRLEQQH